MEMQQSDASLCLIQGKMNAVRGSKAYRFCSILNLSVYERLYSLY